MSGSIIAWRESVRTWVLSGLDDGRAWLSDPRQWKDADRAEQGALVRRFKPPDMNRPCDRNSGIGWMDEPDHGRVRRPLQTALGGRLGRARRYVESLVQERLARLGGRFDAVADYALPIPIETMSWVLGVAPDDLPRLRSMSEAAVSVFDPATDESEAQASRAAVLEIIDLFDDLLARRRVAPADDLVSDLAALQAAGAAITDSEIRVNCMNLLLGGNITTADLIASTLFLLLGHQGDLARLRADPDRIGPVVEEALRLEPPSPGAQRIAASDMTLLGAQICAGQVVAVDVRAANRDPTVFPDPDTFRPGRAEGLHLSFGAGAHICIGAAYAKSIARAAVLGLVQRFADLRLAEPGAAPCWRPGGAFRGLERLPLTAG